MHVMPPHLEVYYASTCAPCRVELPVLQHALVAGQPVRILIVSDVARALVDLKAVSPALTAIAHPASGNGARERLAQAGDSDSILPYSRSVSSRGTVCKSWRGMLTASRIHALLARCT